MLKVLKFGGSSLASGETFEKVKIGEGKETAINNANKYMNEKIPNAEADVDKILQAAEATKAKRIAEAEGEVARFNAMYNEYLKARLNIIRSCFI